MQEIEHLVRYNLFILLLLVTLVKAEFPTNIKYAAKVFAGLSNIMNEEYDLAKQNFEFFRMKNPESPLGDILYAGALIFEREHNHDFLNSKQIDSLLYVAQDSSEALLSRDPEDLWNNYLVALAKTYQTYWKLFKSNYFDGFADGYSALNYFEKCIQLDSSFIEAKVVIGNYYYWSSIKTESFHWLPFIEDRREQGLTALELALTEKFLHRDFALQSLCYAYINEGRLIAAVKLASDLRKKYPNSSKIKSILARAYENLEPLKAIQLYKELVKSYQKKNLNNPYKLIELKNRLARLYFENEMDEEGLKICNEVLKMSAIDELYQLSVLPLIKEMVELCDSAKINKNGED